MQKTMDVFTLSTNITTRAIQVWYFYEIETFSFFYRVQSKWTHFKIRSPYYCRKWTFSFLVCLLGRMQKFFYFQYCFEFGNLLFPAHVLWKILTPWKKQSSAYKIINLCIWVQMRSSKNESPLGMTFYYFFVCRFNWRLLRKRSKCHVQVFQGPIS